MWNCWFFRRCLTARLGRALRRACRTGDWGDAGDSGRGRYAFDTVGTLSWSCVVASDHPLASMLAVKAMIPCAIGRRWSGKHTSRTLPETDYPLLDNHKKGRRTGLGVIGKSCPSAGLCVEIGADAFCPTVDRQRKMGGADAENPLPDAACCVTWQQNEASPTLAWLLDGFGR